MGVVANSDRVLQVLGPSTGGIRRHVGALTCALRDRDWEVDIAGPALVAPDKANGSFHVVPIGARRDALAAIAALRRLAPGFDLVHAHGLTAGWLAAAARLPQPVVVTVHNLVVDAVVGRRAALLRPIEARLPGRVTRTIAISDEIARRFTGLPGAGRIDVIAPVGPRPCPDRTPAATRTALGVPEGTPLVVLVGRLHPQKDIGSFLEAATIVHRDEPEARFVVIGEGPEHERLAALRDRLGLRDTLELVGSRPHAANEMAAADVVVCSSIWESFGFVVAEALELGRPVVATSVGRIPEMVIDGETGRLVAPGGSRPLAAAITELLRSPTLAARLGAAGRDRVRRRFGPELLVDAVIHSYARALHACS